MPRSVGRTLAASLLRAARKALGPEGHVTPRVPPTGAWGSFTEDAPAGLQYSLHALEQAVPGLEELPASFPLDRAALCRLIKANFRRHRGGVEQLADGYTALDQGFAALRAIPEQVYLEQCSSHSVEHGMEVEATASWLNYSLTPEGPRHVFSYRVRVTNHRSGTVQVLGRGWDIINAAGGLEGHVSLSPENAIVGQQPILPPGGAFEYVSGTLVSTPVGAMRGRLAVAPLQGLRRWRHGDEWFKVAVEDFALVQPQAAQGSGSEGSGSGGSSAG